MRLDHPHLHIRKRKTHENLKDYPNPHQGIKLLDRILLIVAILGPLASLPQIFKIYSTQSAGDISLISHVLLMFMTVPWIIYGFVHKERPIIFAYFLWFLFHVSIVAGFILYG
jgi:uncharacterized protein with PQ loop repeat